MGVEHASVHEGVLGTVLEVRMTVAAGAAEAVVDAVLAEIARLDAVFSTYRPDSELSRWRRGEAEAGPELARVLGMAERWYRLSDGAFHPATEGIRAWWLAAEEAGELTGEPPSAGPLPYRTSGDAVERTGDCSGVDLNAIAKGHIVDAALEAGWATGAAERLVVNIGGDLRHRGTGDVVVGIENPHARWDNAPPLARVRVAGRALATSGPRRRGFRVGGRWYGHVLDPRTGWPVVDPVSVTVLAADAATADAAATVLGVGGAAMAERLDVEYLVVAATGRVTRSPGW